MDTSGFCQVGRYGTLSLLKRQPIKGEESVITSFGIDDEELTFGSSTGCGVRLYYPDVDSLHCKIVFEEYKAFLAVLGTSGVYIDGCQVYPHTSGSEGETQQTLIPLTNNSEFEIHSKRFRFAYPPKEMRKALYATPARPPQKALRLSMIHSAQVFSPRPSTDPRENLRVLQSPLKSPAKPRNPSPLKAGTILEESEPEDDSDEEDEEIVLVQTNHPRVVEEEKDLVILEDIPIRLLSPSPTKSSRFPSSSPSKSQFPISPSPQQAQQAPQTPRRRSLGGNALHRAVLIRSAQRAVLKAEKEKEEEEEEMEVLDSVVRIADEEEDSAGIVLEEGMFDLVEEGYDQQREEDEDKTSEEETDDEEEEAYIKKKEAQKSLWRKSIERILPWSRSEEADEANESMETDSTEQTDESMHDDSNDENENINEHGPSGINERDNELKGDENEDPQPLPRRVLGSFMTPGPQRVNVNANGVKRSLFPQAPSTTSGQTQSQNQTDKPAGPGRFSLGGGEARRVIVEQPWRVRDLVVPSLPSLPSLSSLGGGGGASTPVPLTPSKATANGLGLTATGGVNGANGNTPSRPKLTPSVSDEERRAIQERRRSAVNDLSMSWVPGMSPAKGFGTMTESGGTGAEREGRRSRSLSPVKPSGAGGFRPVFGSPTKGRPLDSIIPESDEVESSPRYQGQHERERENRDANDIGNISADSSDSELDTRGLLERMKETVEGMKRRRSVVLGGSFGAGTPGAFGGAGGLSGGGMGAVGGAGTPQIQQEEEQRSLFGPNGTWGVEMPKEKEEQGGEKDDQPLGSQVKKLDFTKITNGSGTPLRSRSKSPLPPSRSSGASSAPNEVRDEAEKEQVPEPQSEQRRFSLLRPGLLEERGRRQTLNLALAASGGINENEKTVPIVLPTVVVDDVDVDMEVEVDEKDAEEEAVEVAKPSKNEDIEMADEESQEEEEQVKQVKKSTKPPSKTRSTAAAATSKETQVNSRATRQRSRTPQPPPASSSSSSLADEKQVPDQDQDEDAEIEAGAVVEPTPAPAPAPAKRGPGRPRKNPTPVPTTESEGSGKPASRVKPPSKTTTATKPTSRSRAGSVAATKSKVSGTKAKVVEEADEEDPLASYEENKDNEEDEEPGDEDEDEDLPAPPPSKSAPAAAKAKAKAIPKTATATTSKIATKTTTATKKRTTTVKKEVEDDSPAPTPAPVKATTATRVGRSATKANTPATGGTSGRTTPATGTRATKATPATGSGAGTTTATKPARGRPKTPATAPAATTTSEKENTPGDASGSGSEVGDDSAGGVVKIRVSRSRAGAGTAAVKTAAASGTKAKAAVGTGRKTPAATAASKKVKVKTEEEDDEEIEAAAPVRTRATRVMRTRVKTS